MYPYKILGIFHLYGLMIAVGILACFGILTLCGKKFKIEEKFIDFVYFNAIVAIALGFGAAALFQATYNYIDNPAEGFKFEGITFIGGLLGGIAVFLGGYAIFRKRYKARVTDILSIAPCCILIAHAFGRIGCLFAGCCHGDLTDAWYGIVQHELVINGVYYESAKVVPTQLFEAIFLFALFAICFILLWKKKFRYNLSVYLIAYGIFRFAIEYLRADDRGGFIPGVSPSQFWSILMVVAGVGLIFLMRWLFKKRDAELALAAEQAGEADGEGAAEKTEENAPATREIVWREAENTESVSEAPAENADSTPTETPVENVAETPAENAESVNSVSETEQNHNEENTEN